MLNMWRSHIGKLTGQQTQSYINLQIALEVEDNKDHNSEYSESTEQEKDE